MDGETDFGLFEILLILGLVGIAGYFLYKLFQSFSCKPLACAVKSAICSLKTNTTGQICACGALAKCVEQTVGCKCAADYGIAEENKLNAACSPNWLQQAINYWFGTSLGYTQPSSPSNAPAAATQGSGGCTAGSAICPPCYGAVTC